MSRQIAIGAVVGFALTVLALSIAERSGRGPGQAELRVLDAGIVVPMQLIESRSKRTGVAEELPVREGGHLGRRSLIESLLADGGT